MCFMLKFKECTWIWSWLGDGHGFKSLQVESDSKTLFDFVKRINKTNGNPLILMHEIYKLLEFN